MLRTERSSVIYAQEETYGVIPSTGWRRFGLHDSANLPDPEIGWVPYYSTRYQNRKQIIRGKHTLSASIPNIQLQSVYPLFPLFPPNDTQYLASISLANDLIDTNGGSVLKRRWGGGRVNRATLSIKEGEALTLSLDEILFQHMEHDREEASINRYAAGGYPTDPGPSSNPRYTFNNVRVRGFSGTQDFLRVKALELSVNNNIYPYYAMRSGQTLDHTLQPARLITGTTEYMLRLTVDFHEAELSLWDYLMNQGSTGGNGPTVGTTFELQFVHPSEPFTISCTLNTSSSRPGTVFSKMEMPLTVSQSGYYTATFTANVDRAVISYVIIS